MSQQAARTDPQELGADEYAKHWLDGEIWKHLALAKHQARFIHLSNLACSNLSGAASFADIGCGAGHSTNYLKRFTDALGQEFRGKWIGYDFSRRLIDKAKEVFAAQEIGFYYLASTDLLVFEPQVDVVFCSEVIEHIADDWYFVGLLWEMARKRLLITTPAVYVKDPGHLRLYDEVSFRDLFQGLCDEDGLPPQVEIEERGPFWY